MAYPKKVRERAIQLAKEGYSAEKIVDTLIKEADIRPLIRRSRVTGDYSLSPRTIRNWLLKEQKGQSLVEKQMYINAEMRLQEHFYELERTAQRLVDNMQRLLDNKNDIGKKSSWAIEGKHWYSHTELHGNIVSGGEIVEIMVDDSGKRFPLELSPGCVFNTLNKSTAASLLEHFNYRFPELSKYTDWIEVTPENIEIGILDKLRLLIYSKNFGVCPSCPVCKDIITHK